MYFNLRDVDLRVGETLTLRKRDSDRAIIVQIITIRYENRDPLEYLVYEVFPDPEGITALMERVQKMLSDLEGETLPDDTLPEDHWAHRYCPYLEICEPGQKAMTWQAQQPKTLPDEVLANMIAKRIVAKKRCGKNDRKETEERPALAVRAGGRVGVGVRADYQPIPLPVMQPVDLLGNG